MNDNEIKVDLKQRGILKGVINKSFLYVTTSDKVFDIRHDGIKKSYDGDLGEGVYCIGIEDLGSLIAVLESDSFKDDGYSIYDLMVIDFKYSGDCRIYKPDMSKYKDQRWIVINANIQSNQVNDAFRAIDYLRKNNIIFKRRLYL